MNIFTWTSFTTKERQNKEVERPTQNIAVKQILRLAVQYLPCGVHHSGRWVLMVSSVPTVTDTSQSPPPPLELHGKSFRDTKYWRDGSQPLQYEDGMVGERTKNPEMKIALLYEVIHLLASLKVQHIFKTCSLRYSNATYSYCDSPNASLQEMQGLGPSSSGSPQVHIILFSISTVKECKAQIKK